MESVIREIESASVRTDHPELRSGDTLRVHTKIKEGEKERIQVFEGILIRLRRGGNRATITVRKVSHGVGVERIFPLSAPSIQKIEVKSRGLVRRAKLYYLRDLSGKAARIKERVDQRPAKKKKAAAKKKTKARKAKKA